MLSKARDIACALCFAIGLMSSGMLAASEVPVPESIQSSEDFGIFTFFPSTPNVLYLFGDIQSDQVIEFRKAVTEHDVNTVD